MLLKFFTVIFPSVVFGSDAIQAAIDLAGSSFTNIFISLQPTAPLKSNAVALEKLALINVIYSGWSQ